MWERPTNLRRTEGESREQLDHALRITKHDTSNRIIDPLAQRLVRALRRARLPVQLVAQRHHRVGADDQVGRPTAVGCCSDAQSSVHFEHLLARRLLDEGAERGEVARVEVLLEQRGAEFGLEALRV